MKTNREHVRNIKNRTSKYPPALPGDTHFKKEAENTAPFLLPVEESHAVCHLSPCYHVREVGDVQSHKYNSV